MPCDACSIHNYIHIHCFLYAHLFSRDGTSFNNNLIITMSSIESESPTLSLYQCLPYIILLITILSFRFQTPSFRNWAIVVLGTLATWMVIPTPSGGAIIVFLGLLMLSITLSPLQRILQDDTTRSRPPNHKSIDTLHDPADAECE